MGLPTKRNIRQLRIREINEKNKERMMEYIKGDWEVIDAPDMERVFIYANSEKIGCLVCQLDNSSMPKEEKLANARLIVAAVNACKSINSDNPLAVAESIKEVREALKEMLYDEVIGTQAIELAEQALAKTEVK